MITSYNRTGWSPSLNAGRDPPEFPRGVLLQEDLKKKEFHGPDPKFFLFFIFFLFPSPPLLFSTEKKNRGTTVAATPLTRFLYKRRQDPLGEFAEAACIQARLIPTHPKGL